MSLEDMELRDLVKDLMEIGNCIEETMESQSVHAPPEVRARSKAQRPIFLKCEALLSGELHRRLGGRGELAEVAIDAMEEYVFDQQKHKILADTFGPLESQEDVEKREAEEREAFRVLHPEVLPPPVVLPLTRAEADIEAVRYAARAATEAAEALTVAPVSKPSDTILKAMKQAAWHSIQRLGTDVLVEYLKMWVVKHHDYGTENHAVWGCQGAIIRATDKLMRLKGSYFNGRTMKIVENDWMDLIGYGLIGLIVERGQWPVATFEAIIEDMRGANSDAYERMVESLVEEEYDDMTDTDREPIHCPVCSSKNITTRSTRLPSAEHDRYEVVLECRDCVVPERFNGVTRGTETEQETIARLYHKWHKGWERYRHEHD